MDSDKLGLQKNWAYREIGPSMITLKAKGTKYIELLKKDILV